MSDTGYVNSAVPVELIWKWALVMKTSRGGVAGDMCKKSRQVQKKVCRIGLEGGGVVITFFFGLRPALQASFHNLLVTAKVSKSRNPPPLLPQIPKSQDVDLQTSLT